MKKQILNELATMFDANTVINQYGDLLIDEIAELDDADFENTSAEEILSDTCEYVLQDLRDALDAHDISAEDFVHYKNKILTIMP